MATLGWVRRDIRGQREENAWEEGGVERRRGNLARPNTDV